MNDKQKKSGQGTALIFSKAFAAAFALMPLIAFLSPRFLAFWPGIAGLVLSVLHYLCCGKKPELSKTVLLWAGGLILLAGISSLWALDPAFALSRTLKMAAIIVPGLLLAGTVQAADLAQIRPYLKYIPYMWAVGAGLLSLDMISNFALSRLLHDIDFSESFEAASLNRPVIAICAITFSGFAILRQEKSSRFALLLALPSLPVLFLTDSQSAQLGTLLALLFFFLFPYGRKWAWRLVAGLLVAGLMLAPFLAQWLFSAFAETVAQLPFFGTGGGYGAQRLEIWDAVARKALENPLYGFGVEATRAVESFDTAQIYRKSDTELHPHNFAIQLWIEFGIIGAVLGSAFFIRFFRFLSRCDFDQARVILPTFIFLLPVLTFGYGLWQSWFLGLFVFIFAFAKLGMRMYEKKG